MHNSRFLKMLIRGECPNYWKLHGDHHLEAGGMYIFSKKISTEEG